MLNQYLILQIFCAKSLFAHLLGKVQSKPALLNFLYSPKADLKTGCLKQEQLQIRATPNEYVELLYYYTRINDGSRRDTKATPFIGSQGTAWVGLHPGLDPILLSIMTTAPATPMGLHRQTGKQGQ